MHYLYEIKNLMNNKVYIGQTKNPEKRWKRHKYEANKTAKHQYIHRAMAKYGIDNFIFTVIGQAKTQVEADAMEIELIRQYDSRNQDKGYNFRAGGYVSERSEETRQKIANALHGRKFTDEHKEKISISNTGKTHTKAAKNKIRQANLGKKLSNETKNKISNIKTGVPNLWQLNRPLSEEHKQKISLANKGHVVSGEAKKKMSSYTKDKRYNYIQFTKDEIFAIKQDSRFLSKIAKDYDVSKSTIHKVKKGFYE